MAEREGVVQYEVDFDAGPAVPPEVVHRLDGWRTVLHRLELVGQHPGRYEGLGYGNVSVRAGGGFVITGTQTGAPERLGPGGYVRVLSADPRANRLRARGPVRPSSEALTHAACYEAGDSIGCVLHAHSPELWGRAAVLGIPITDPAIGYGTPAMAEAVARALAGGAELVAMGGHEDGVLAVGPDPDRAGRALVGALATALATALASAPVSAPGARPGQRPG